MLAWLAHCACPMTGDIARHMPCMCTITLCTSEMILWWNSLQTFSNHRSEQIHRGLAHRRQFSGSCLAGRRRVLGAHKTATVLLSVYLRELSNSQLSI